MINVRDGYNFPYSENIPSLSRKLHAEQRQHNRCHLACILQRSHSVCDWSDKANRSPFYNVGAIFDSISNEPCMWMKDAFIHLSYGWKEPKTFVIFFKQRKQCKDESNKESTTTQVAHEDLNDVNDPTKKMPSKLKENSSLDGLKATHGWIMIKKTTAWSAVDMSMFG